MTSYVATRPDDTSFEQAKPHSGCENDRQPGNEKKVVTIFRVEKHGEHRPQKRYKCANNNSLRKASAEPWQLINWRFPEAAREDLAVDVWRSLMRNCDVALDHVDSLSFPSGNASLISSTSRSACLRSGRINGLLARWINLSSRSTV